MPELILPRPDAACGKTFYADRRAAEGHRVALEVWVRATGRTREGYRLAVFRCKRCGGFHIGQKPIERLGAQTSPPSNNERDREHGEEAHEPRRARCTLRLDAFL